MQWNAAGAATLATAITADKATTVLGFNEPDNGGQANMTPAAAAAGKSSIDSWPLSARMRMKRLIYSSRGCASLEAIHPTSRGQGNQACLPRFYLWRSSGWNYLVRPVCWQLHFVHLGCCRSVLPVVSTRQVVMILIPMHSTACHWYGGMYDSDPSPNSCSYSRMNLSFPH